MNTKQINIECAKLDGWATNGQWWTKDNDHMSFKDCRYTTSYDAIIPLIQKQEQWVQVSVYEYLVKQTGDNFCIRSTPLQLSEALLKARGITLTF